MRVKGHLWEDASGRRIEPLALAPLLYLHGAIAWPEDISTLPPGRLVDVDVESSAAGLRAATTIELLSPDETTLADLDKTLDDVAADLHTKGSLPPVTSGEAVAVLVDWGSLQHADHAELGSYLLAAIRRRLRQRVATTAFRLLRLSLQAYRGASSLSLDFPPTPSTVLVGVNGSGKTSVLDAIATLLCQQEALFRQKDPPERPIADDDIMHGRHEVQIALDVALGADSRSYQASHSTLTQFPIFRARPGEALQGQAQVDAKKAVVAMLVASAVGHEIDEGRESLPLAIYYPVNRAVLDNPERIRTRHDFGPLNAYDGALVGGQSNFRLFFEWFREREDLENERRIVQSEHRDNQLEAVRRAIASIVHEFSNLRVQRAPQRMVVDKDERTFFIDQLSDGEKCLLALVGDLARRLAMANPRLDDPLRGSGVVIIDEIELHLHPGWQRRVVPALERAFANCQFVITTHSPQVLGHVPANSIVVLEPTAAGIAAYRPDNSLGMAANRILEDIFGVSERPEEQKQQILALFRLIDAGRLDDARARLSDLRSLLGMDPEIVRAEMLLTRKERLGR